ncbi:hypothetical protein SAMN05444141_102651 [Pseudovibrio denitrificans]|uniref:Uncharacterized protein n=1 Tax=Pseudovibrio denitrificans TaxID=258256 RepID=A0A1I6ZVY9_9HYPH|nr:hypothetical protein [Pseudovibrio denitrificans]SFT66880.1 hypothetical protein SAMN05444141_102651 [Pseudovibrio denitrificans]
MTTQTPSQIPTPTPPKTYTRRELCEVLGLKENNFDRVRKDLEGSGFPTRLPGLARWSRPAVHAWIASNGDEHLMRQILVGPEPETPSIEPSASLLQKYAGAAA